MSDISGSQAIVQCLLEEGVTTVFGYPGGAVIDLYDELMQCQDLTHVLVRHEQAAVHAADGYARVTGDVGVALLTSGPGATNGVTGIATAYMDSIPVVILTGQVPTPLIGNDAFQEVDIVGITRPCTKHNYLVSSKDDLVQIIHEAFHVARTGRPGPVHWIRNSRRCNDSILDECSMAYGSPDILGERNRKFGTVHDSSNFQNGHTWRNGTGRYVHMYRKGGFHNTGRCAAIRGLTFIAKSADVHWNIHIHNDSPLRNGHDVRIIVHALGQAGCAHVQPTYRADLSDIWLLVSNQSFSESGNTRFRQRKCFSINIIKFNRNITSYFHMLFLIFANRF